MTTPNRGTPPTHISPVAAKETAYGSGNGGSDNNHGKQPEGVRYFLAALVVMLGAEFAHQVLNITMILLDPSELLKSARDANKNAAQQASDQQVTMVAYTSIAIMALFSLLIVLLLAIAVSAVAKQKGWADNARTLLMVFAGFFALRMLTLFMVTAGAGMDIPTPVIALDGAVQIIAGVAGVCAIIFAMQDEVKKWTAKKDAKGPRGDHNDPSNNAMR